MTDADPATGRDAASDAPRLWRAVSALGVAQIISWGTLFYTIAVLGASMRADTHASEIVLFGAFTAGLFLSGLASPWIGRRIDSHGGRGVLASGSVLGALAMAILGTAQEPVAMVAGWLVAGIAMAACLYDPAFVTLHQIAGSSYRRAVTALTLYGGFASTVFWPLSQYLLETTGWRNAFYLYAILHLTICLPIHLACVPPFRRPARHAESATTTTASSHPRGGATFAWLASAFALATFISSALAAHLIEMLTATGLTARDAVMIGTLVGPMQVAGRIMEFAFARHLRALAVGTLAFTLMAIAVLVFTQVRGIWIVAIAFVIPYGWSNGVMTIVRGTVPAELFGQRDYGALLGRLAQPQFIAKAFAPLAMTLVFAVDSTRAISVYALCGVAIAALVAYQLALRSRTRHRLH
ncbi:MAG: MFS transporter [Betaproteobacteria bacterium]